MAVYCKSWVSLVEMMRSEDTLFNGWLQQHLSYIRKQAPAAAGMPDADLLSCTYKPNNLVCIAQALLDLWREENRKTPY